MINALSVYGNGAHVSSPEITPEDILKLSHSQVCTCMYTLDELKSFSQDRLVNIYLGIRALGGRGPWRRERTLSQVRSRSNYRRKTKRRKAERSGKQ